MSARGFKEAYRIISKISCAGTKGLHEIESSGDNNVREQR